MFADSAKNAAVQSNQLDSLEVLYRWLSTVHFANKEYEKAMVDIQIALSYKDSMARQSWQMAEDDLNSRLELEKKGHQQDIRKQIEEVKMMEALTQKNERNGIIISFSVFALLAVAILAINRKRIQAQRAYEQALANLTELQAFKEKLFTVLSYDLTKSLTGFENLTQSLSGQMGTFTKEEGVQLLKQIHVTAGELKISINNVIHWIAYQANARAYQPSLFDIKNITERALAKFQLSMTDKQLVSQLFIPDNQIVFADAEMVEIVLSNLISNAIQFTHAGGSITCFSGKKDGLVLIGVKDTGMGISEENCKKLFETREDFHSIGKSSHKGVGVGLILSKDLVERNGGRIYVESTVGQGSTFYFTLPEKKID